MTVIDILKATTKEGIVLTAPGENRLHVSAPAGALTPELKVTLMSYKPDLLRVLPRLAGMRANVGKVPVPCAVFEALGGPGRCFSCGDPHEHPLAYGRCSACAIAAELLYSEVPDAADRWQVTDAPTAPR